METGYSVAKHQGDLFLFTTALNLADAISTPSRRPRERLLSQLGWVSLVAAGAAIVAVTWFAIHLPV